MGEPGLCGRRHGRNVVDVDEMQALADRKPYFTYVGGRKAKQIAADRHFNHAADRPKEKN